ncbi:hypothetical protein N7474_011030 [Penicillium riverlandense]|uniref:uncharacterized protein n=1 Tax=Penicillium riverlandense TaxID=1903569 RepID=UPI002546CB16|nr:uncharacterized protein N7474_011030 [Penicillium riverlandense]KAJ5805143.1 hypothetical protein N7474_011030 [Penicillium riverlandense]
MSRYNDDYRSSTGTLDSRDRYDRYSRGPPVAERPRHADEERFEFRLREEDSYGPPARAPDRYYEDDHLDHPPDRRRQQRRDDSPDFRPPRLVRRQSSLDTFDRLPPRRMEAPLRRSGPGAPPPARSRGAGPVPAPPPPRRRSPPRYHEREVYEEIHIAEPEYYGDEEYRDIRDRDRMAARRRSSSAARHREEKPYPRKGKTRLPRKLAHTRAISELGYPYKEEVAYYVARSPSPIRRPRERVTTETLLVRSPSPRSSHEEFILESSPSRYEDIEFEEIIERPRHFQTISRPRSVSVHGRRVSSPARYVEPRFFEERIESDSLHPGSMVLVRPRSSENDVRDLEREIRTLQLERQGGIEITRERETDWIDSNGNEEEITELSSANFSPFAQRTQQLIKEQLGQADEKTQLPDEYIELEKRVDALKLVHQKLLQVTSQYSNEAYDYPPNIRESFNDLGRTINDKVTLLSQANSPAEAQAALTAPPSAKPQPKTFNHAIARASLAGSQTLAQSSETEDPLASALEKYALAEEKVGEARLAQDAQIQSRFLAGWNTTLNTNLMFAAKARKNVENARLMLDSIKASKKAAARGDLDNLSEDARAEIEQAEDEFVGQTEEAVSVMKNVLDTPEPLRNLADLIAAQLEFHKKAYEILSELAPVVDGLQVEQEVSWAQSVPVHP